MDDEGVGSGTPKPINIEGKRVDSRIQSSLVASLKQSDFWDVTVGPFYDARGLTKWLGITRQVLQDRTQAGIILSVATTEGDPLYPSFQFGPAGEPLPHLSQILRLLEPIADDAWDKALWLNTPSVTFDKRTAVDALRAGCAELVLAAAARDGGLLEA
jgi:hypothetical protein